MRRSKLKGFAYNIAQKFAASAEHFAFIALSNQTPALTVDLLSGRITPDVFDIKRNRILVGHCMDSLNHILSKERSVQLRSAVLTVDYSFARVPSDGGDRYIFGVVYTVTLVDNRGREYKGHFTPSTQLMAQ